MPRERMDVPTRSALSRAIIAGFGLEAEPLLPAPLSLLPSRKP